MPNEIVMSNEKRTSLSTNPPLLSFSQRPGDLANHGGYSDCCRGQLGAGAAALGRQSGRLGGGSVAVAQATSAVTMSAQGAER